MKKILVGFVFGVVLAGAAFATGVQDSVTVSGKLVVTDGIPTITEKGKTWIIPSGPFYQVAWENGVKTGDSVKIEGLDRGTREDCKIEGAHVLVPSKVSVNGKELVMTEIANRGHGSMNAAGPRVRNNSERGSNSQNGKRSGSRISENGFRNRS